MFHKILKVSFTVLFLSMLIIPLVTTNLQREKVSEAEKRKLAAPASFYNEDGTRNTNYTADFETWINDNIGFRSEMVIQNAKIQFHLFNVLSNNSDMLLGPNGELNYATNDIIRSYQHYDLKSEDTLNKIADSYQYYSDYLKAKGIQFYYYQCWDKHSIYPEYFPRTITQFGDISKTDQIVDTLANRTTVNVISPKQALIDAKDEYATYSVWGDATHWTQRGAYIGYQLLMDEINKNNDGRYKVLTEDDYNITITDQGETLFGGIHKADMLENFEIKDPKAYKTGEEPLLRTQWGDSSHQVFFNDSVDNEDTLLIIGDSYFDGFLYDDLAESFHRVVQVWGEYVGNIEELVEYYHPVIVICENAERCDRTGAMINAAAAMKENLGISE